MVSRIADKKSRSATSNRRGSQRRTVEKRVLLTQREEQKFQQITHQLSRVAECRVSFADIVRASLNLISDRHREMQKEIKKDAPLHRPVNGDIPGAVSFEKDLTEYLKKGLRARKR